MEDEPIEAQPVLESRFEKNISPEEYARRLRTDSAVMVQQIEQREEKTRLEESETSFGMARKIKLALGLGIFVAGSTVTSVAAEDESLGLLGSGLAAMTTGAVLAVRQSPETVEILRQTFLPHRRQ